MSDNGDAKYVFITENGEEKSTSRGYNGRATAKYPDGDVYEGNFLGGERDGQGIYSYKNGDKYNGEWRLNNKHGLGKMIFKNGTGGEYNGCWENGMRHGEGVFRYANGDTYSGWWKHGEKQGTGTYTFNANRMRMYGEWEVGQMLTGKWIYPNGMTYQGSFKNNKPCGEGRWVFTNGSELTGTYKQNELVKEEDDEEENKGPAPVKLQWCSDSCITQSANKVNSVEEMVRQEALSNV